MPNYKYVIQRFPIHADIYKTPPDLVRYVHTTFEWDDLNIASECIRESIIKIERLHGDDILDMDDDIREEYERLNDVKDKIDALMKEFR